MESLAGLPAEMSAYLPSHGHVAGMVGKLVLRLENNSLHGKTCIKEQYSKVPFIPSRALYLEEFFPSMAFVYIMSVSGGMLRGDRYGIDISLGNKATVHITTQGATRIYRMEKDCALQDINITMEDGAYLEYIPDQIIPYSGSRFCQRSNLQVHDNATMVYSEVLAPGRMAGGESFKYDICCLKTIARNHQGKVRFIDAAILEPSKMYLGLREAFGRFMLVGSIYILADRRHTLKLKKEINTILQGRRKAASSLLPDNSGIMVRFVGNNMTEIREIIYCVVKMVRKQVLGSPFSGIRKS